MAKQQPAVKIAHALLTPVRHPIKAARLIYSAPAWVLAGPIYLVTVIVFTSLAYSFWASKDELVVAPLVLERESFTVEATEAGLISRVRAKEGDSVRALVDTLVVIQKTMVTAKGERESLKSKKEELEDERAVADKEYLHSREQLNITLTETTKTLANLKKDRTLLTNQLDDGRRNIAYLLKKLNKARRDLAKERALYLSRDITQAEYDRAKNKVDDLEKSHQDAVANVQKIEINLAALSESRIRSEITRIENELAQHDQRHKTAEKRFIERLADIKHQLEREETLVATTTREGERTRYSSLFSGVITKVHVKPGQMVAAGTPLITIIKGSAALEGRALVQNKDIGRMDHGDLVQIKYFAYPYQEYGIPTGKISYIAKKPGGVAGQESLYLVRVALASDTIKKQGSKRLKKLEIGLEGMAEIKTGQKRFIELMFTPISKFFTQEEG